MKIAILTNVSKGTALGRISDIEMKGSGSWHPRHYKNQNAYKIPNSPYLDKIMSTNSLICFKCMEEIEVGDRYQYKSKKCRITKYYHCSCYEDMYQ